MLTIYSQYFVLTIVPTEFCGNTLRDGGLSPSVIVTEDIATSADDAIGTGTVRGGWVPEDGRGTCHAQTFDFDRAKVVYRSKRDVENCLD